MCCCTIGCWKRRRSSASAGGSAFRAIGGFGRHGILHAEHFFDLAGDVAVEVELAVTDDEAERMMARVRDERITVFFVRIPVEFGTIEP
jgi:PII-like signaling protein